MGRREKGSWWYSGGGKRLRALVLSATSVMFLSIAARSANEALRVSVEYGIFNESWCNLEIRGEKVNKVAVVVSRGACLLVAFVLTSIKKNRRGLVAPGEREHDLRGIMEFKLHWIAWASSDFFICVLAVFGIRPRFYMRLIALSAALLSYGLGFLLYRYLSASHHGVMAPEQTYTKLILITAMCTGIALYAAMSTNQNQSYLFTTAPPIIPSNTMSSSLLFLARLALSFGAFFLGLVLLDLIDIISLADSKRVASPSSPTTNNYERIRSTAWSITVSFLLALFVEQVAHHIATSEAIASILAVALYIFPSLSLMYWYVRRAEIAQDIAIKAVEHVHRTGRLDLARRRRDRLDQRVLLLNDGLALGLGRLLQITIATQICASDSIVRLTRLVILWILALGFTSCTPFIYAYLARQQAAILQVDELSISNSFNSLDTAIWNPENFAPTIDDEDNFFDDDGIDDDCELGPSHTIAMPLSSDKKKIMTPSQHEQEAQMQAAIESGRRLATSSSSGTHRSVSSPLHARTNDDLKEEDHYNSPKDDATCSDDYNFLRSTIPAALTPDEDYQEEAPQPNTPAETFLATPMSQTQADLW